MARRPNYRGDRIERERAKATKKAKRLEARAEKSARTRGEKPADGTEETRDPDPAEPGDGEENT